MQIVEELSLNKGGGFGKKDESDNLDDQTYAEKLVFSDEFLEALRSLKVAEKSKDGNVIGGNILIGNEDVLPFRDDDKAIGMNGICHKINQVFVASEIPFFATSYASDSATRTVKTKTRGNKIGETYKAVEADLVRIFRITEKFQVEKYACKDGTYKQVAYQEPTLGMRRRSQKIMERDGIAF